MERVINGVVYDVVIVNDQIFAIDRSVAVLAPATIAAGATYTSPAIPSMAMPHIAVAVILDQAGTIILQPYLDLAGLIPAGLVGLYQTPLTASTASIIDVAPKTIFQSFRVSIINRSGVTANLSGATAILRSDTTLGTFLGGRAGGTGLVTGASNLKASLVAGFGGTGLVTGASNLKASLVAGFAGSGNVSVPANAKLSLTSSIAGSGGVSAVSS